MRRVLLGTAALLSLAVLPGCGDDGEGDQLPGGTFAGSTATDRAFVLEVGNEVTVNKRKARFIDRGVIEVPGTDVPTTLACKVLDDKGEELRCTLRTAPENGNPTTEVIDLMLL